jgi:nucleotide-binding universal stress UspA family protein
VDGSKGSLAAAEAFLQLFACMRPKKTVLLYVEKPEGLSLMDDMLGEPELSTLKEELQKSGYKEHLDARARRVLEHFATLLEKKGVQGLETVVRMGHPAEEILKEAQEKKAGLIVMGSRGRRLHNLFMGSVSREVANTAQVPVLIAR